MARLKFFQILGIALLIVGLTMFGFSQYIKGRVEEGRGQIAEGEETVEKGKALFSLDPVTKEIGDMAIINPAQKKIIEGKEQADRYEKLSKWLQIFGIIFVIGGISLIVFSKKRKR